MRTWHWASTTAAALTMAGAVTCPAVAVEQASEQDSTYLKASHQGNLAEIAAGQDAQRNAATSCVRNVGAVLVRDHTRLDAQDKALAGKLGVSLPGTPTAEQQQQLAAVRAKAGTPEYDRAWLRLQAASHEKTLALIDQEIRTGRHPEVRASARAARPVVAMHLEAVRGGTCRAPAHAMTVPSGSGGQAADSPGVRQHAGAAALGGGVLLAASGAVWAARARRAAAGR
ncbi:MAG TPA: DUF4142 domain-containing protein [Streptomyces sp.]|uniref:DUF4142 domain-containing protein n=1 Tax=Streptomyces sp. TaxID=1931 RepID=UPI002D4EF851|nr:DUF4142 domain-containing protein [Streptomyces sp.]HZG05648.1 DUF4142 domain-containing protein [Streptomyces sp.]